MPVRMRGDAGGPGGSFAIHAIGWPAIAASERLR